jgi:GTP cyclohydrolase II
MIPYKIVSHTPACFIQNGLGRFSLQMFRLGFVGRFEDVAVIFKEPRQNDCLLRINSACITSESFGDVSCDCKWQMDEALRIIESEASGLIIYAPGQEGRGIGLFDKVRTMHLMQTQMLSTAGAFKALNFEPDGRSYEFVIPLLRFFGIKSVRLMTNNPEKVAVLRDANIEVTGIVSLVHTSQSSLHPYLVSKKHEFGHLIDIEEANQDAR